MKNLTILLLLILSTKIYAQTEYYSTDDKNRISKLELDKMSEELKVKYTKILKKQMFVNIEIKNTIKKKDSIIHKISFSINDKKTESKFKNGSLSDLKNKEFINFNLINILGDNFNSEKLKGKPTLINFWLGLTVAQIL